MKKFQIPLKAIAWKLILLHLIQIGESSVASITAISGQPVTKPTNPTKNDTKFLGMV